jgi:hypothetical protein
MSSSLGFLSFTSCFSSSLFFLLAAILKSWIFSLVAPSSRTKSGNLKNAAVWEKVIINSSVLGVLGNSIQNFLLWGNSLKPYAAIEEYYLYQTVEDMVIFLIETRKMCLLLFKYRENKHPTAIKYHEKIISQIVILKTKYNLQIFLLFALINSNLL